MCLGAWDFARRWAHGDVSQALGLASVLCCGSVCATSSAFAQASEAPLELVWRAPHGCPVEADVLERIRRYLPALEAVPAHVRAEARVMRSGARYRLVLSLRSGDTIARRRLEVDSCEAATDVAALLVALALDPNAAADHGVADTAEPSAAVGTDTERAANPPATGRRARSPA